MLIVLLIRGNIMIRFVFWDVQHGHATYLETPKQHIVIDLGTGSYGGKQEFSPLLHLKNTWNVNQLDGVLITHPHRDHLDDIFNFNELSPRVLWRPQHLKQEDIYQGNRTNDRDVIDKYLEIDGRFNQTVSRENDPFLAENNGGVKFEVFTSKFCSKSNLNNHSMVAIVSYESCKMLIPRDNEPPSWDELLKNPAFINAIRGTDILLAPHHGRESGFSTDLFKHISPYLTVISDGRFCDTSATSLYSSKSKGWTVHRRNGNDEQRKCVTTRHDGVIVVEFGKNANGGPYINVTVD